MEVSTKNGIMKWGGRIVIGVGSLFAWLFGTHIWDKKCDKATAEGRLVGEKNFEKSSEYVKKEVLPPVAKAATGVIIETLSDTMRSLPEKKQ